MAHHCIECGVKCHCEGDIDDLILRENIFCTHCDNDDFDEDDYYEQWDRLSELLPTRTG